MQPTPSFDDLAARLRAGKFDLAILLTNSFKTALMCKMANIDRVVGYERDGRGFLLTDKLLPTKDKGKTLSRAAKHERQLKVSNRKWRSRTS